MTMVNETNTQEETQLSGVEIVGVVLVGLMIAIGTWASLNWLYNRVFPKTPLQTTSQKVDTDTSGVRITRVGCHDLWVAKDNLCVEFSWPGHSSLVMVKPDATDSQIIEAVKKEMKEIEDREWNRKAQENSLLDMQKRLNGLLAE